ncbi:hypothetical protein GEMRC1_012909 [Eukaryota sp. GEM-RC1]
MVNIGSYSIVQEDKRITSFDLDTIDMVMTSRYSIPCDHSVCLPSCKCSCDVNCTQKSASDSVTSSLPLQKLPLVVINTRRCIYLQQSILVMINCHLANLHLKSCLEVDSDGSAHTLCSLQNQLRSFFNTIGYVSQRFYECTFQALAVFFQTNTFHVHSSDLSLLSSLSSFFGAELQSVFLHVHGAFKTQDIMRFTSIISRLKINIVFHDSVLDFFNHSPMHLPHLKRLDTVSCLFDSAGSISQSLVSSATIEELNVCIRTNNFDFTSKVVSLAEVLECIRSLKKLKFL